jgi:hypothetical protein
MTDTTRVDAIETTGLPGIPRQPGAGVTINTVPPPDSSRKFVGIVWRWLPATVTALAVVTMLLVVHTSMIDIVRYAAYVLWCLILPGTLAYRALRRRPHSLVDDLAVGTAVGMALEVAAWAAFGSLGAQRLQWLWPLLVVVPFVAVPRLRRHWRTPPGYASPSPAWSWVVGGIVVFAVGYLVVGLLWYTPAVPAAAGAWYHIDDTYLLSLVAEAKSHFPMQYPTITGEVLHYHIFTFAHEGSASLVSGVDTPVVFYQLALPTIISLSTVLLAVAGWRIADRLWVGALAAALVFVVGEFTFSFRSASEFGAVFAYYSYSSPSHTYSLIFTFALIAALVPVLRRDVMPVPAGDVDAPGPRWGDWTLIALLALAASGAKSTVLPVVLAGLGAAGLAELVGRRRIGLDLLAAASVALGAFLFGLAVLYRFQSNGLSWGPLALVPADGSWQRRAYIYTGAAIGYAIYMFARAAGIPVLFALTGRRWGRVEWFLLGAFGSGAVAAVTLVHPGLSQNFFIATSFGFGAILSAMGLVTLVERHRLPVRTVAVVVGAVAMAVLGLFVILRHWRAPLLVVRSWGLPGDRAVVEPAVVLALVGLAVTAFWLIVVGRRRWVRRGVGVTAALAAVLLAGLPSLMTDARTLQSGHGRVWHVFVSSGQAQAARWLRSNSSPDDIVATNEHCIKHPYLTVDCLSLSFWLAAYSERRQLVGSWAYAPRLTSVGGSPSFSYPFWDQRLLADNDIVFTDPTAENVRTLRVDHGVRWLVVNRAVRRESPALATFARLRLEQGQVAIYELTRSP